MIESVQIERLRGIRSGRVDGLAPLTVLVGQNGSGKSTVLDALLIGCSSDLNAAIIQAVQRRPNIDFGAPWLVWQAGRGDNTAVVSLCDDMGVITSTGLRYESREAEDRVTIEVSRPSVSSSFLNLRNDTPAVTFAKGNEVATSTPADRRATTSTSLIEPTRGERLDRLLTEAIKGGRRRAVESLLSEVIPGLVSVLMLTDKAGNPEVHFEYEWGSVPVALAGDGLRALTRLVYALATPKDALLLVEEPEVHMHPRALDAAARAMVATVGRGNQVVVSTHSLDLIDDLIRAADAAGKLDDFAVFRTAIVDGELRTSRFPGDEAKFARDQIEEDLR